LFAQTSSAAPLTLPAHASLFTARFPPGHGVRDNAGFVLDPSQITLAELLQQRGYRTGAFVGSFVLASSGGLSQGFETYGDDFKGSPGRPRQAGVQRRADEVTDEALSWLANAGTSRVFAWLHFYDPHLPYDPPEPYRTQYAGRPYDGEIAFVDAQIGRVLAFLEQRKLLERTIVVVIGDHGEGLGEHGEATHAVFVYESVIRVPFIVRTPFRQLRGRIVDAVTRSVDMLPTLLDLVEVDAPAQIDGSSLLPLMAGGTRELDLDAYSESLFPLHWFGWSDLRALRAGRFKVIDAPRPELYDLQSDPFEERNVFEAQRPLAERLLARLRDVESRSAATPPSGQSQIEVDPDRAAKLASLGYLSRSQAAAADRDAALPDPKDHIGRIDWGGPR
jgi:arylsulfatase A-like enzyme